MQDLTLVGVHDDGEHLVLSGPDGQQYTVRVTDAVRAAVRLDRPRLGQLQFESDGRLRPRDIQARIRAGQTAQQIADAAGVPVEQVRRFEGPVLAEREFVVRQAQAVRVRRGGRAAPATTLGDLVAERLTGRSVEEDATRWDAWRGEDGVWVVELTFTSDDRDRRASWSYDAQLRHVTPRDDEARWLTDEDVEEPTPRPRRLAPVGGSGPRRAAPETASSDGPVRDRVYDIEADGGVRPGDAARPPAATVDLLDSLRERRGRRQRTGSAADGEPVGRPAPDPMDAALHAGPRADLPAGLTAGHPSTGRPAPERSGTGRSTLPPPAHPPTTRPDLARDAEVLVLPDAETLDAAITLAEQGPPAEPELPGEQSPEAAAPAPVEEEPAPAPERPGSNRRARRASVPKWDDIVFGSRRE